MNNSKIEMVESRRKDWSQEGVKIDETLKFGEKEVQIKEKVIDILCVYKEPDEPIGMVRSTKVVDEGIPVRTSDIAGSVSLTSVHDNPSKPVSTLKWSP